jgi:hypothetical protein
VRGGPAGVATRGRCRRASRRYTNSR